MAAKAVKDRANTLLDKALDALDEGEYKDTLILASKAEQVAKIASAHDLCVDCLVVKAKAHWLSDEYKNAKKVLSQAIALAKQDGSATYYSYVLSEAAKIDLACSKFKSAHALTTKALTLARKSEQPLLELDALRLLQKIAEEQGNYASSEVYYRSALKLTNQKELKTWKATLLFSGGILATRKQNYGQALDLFEEAASLSRKRKDWQLLYDILLASASVYSEVEDKEKTEDCFREAFSLPFDKHVDGNLFLSLEQKGKALLRISQYDKARNLYDHIGEELARLGEENTFPIFYISWAEACIGVKEYSKAKSALWHAVDLMKSDINDNWQLFSQALNRLALCYKALKQADVGDVLTKYASRLNELLSVPKKHPKRERLSIEEFIGGLPDKLDYIRDNQEKYLVWKNVIVDLDMGTIKIGRKKKALKLSERQRVVLRLLKARIVGKAVTPAEIIDEIALEKPDRDDRSDWIIKRAKYYVDEIRKKTRKDMILNDWGKGYYIPHKKIK